MAQVATGIARMRSVLMGAKVRRCMTLQLSEETVAAVARVQSLLVGANTRRGVALHTLADTHAADAASLQLQIAVESTNSKDHGKS